MDEAEQRERPENYQEAQSIINCLAENMNAWGAPEMPHGDSFEGVGDDQVFIEL